MPTRQCAGKNKNTGEQCQKQIEINTVQTTEYCPDCRFDPLMRKKPPSLSRITEPQASQQQTPTAPNSTDAPVPQPQPDRKPKLDAVQQPTDSQQPTDHGPPEPEPNDFVPTEQERAEYHAARDAESDADSQKPKRKPKRKPLQALQELELPVHIYDVDEIEEIKATLIAASDAKQADNGQQPPPLPISPPTTDDILTPLTAALASADNTDAILAALAALAWAEIKGFPAECPIPTDAALRHYCPIQRKGQPVSLEEIQEDWKQRKPRPEHPLLALVANWQMIYFGERLFPEIVEPFYPRKKGTLPAFREQWQALFSQCLHQGRSASWELRLLVGVFLHLNIKHRDGQWRVLRFSTEDVIAWLFPHGWTNKKRDWHQLPAALERLNALGWLHIPGLGSVRLIEATIIPRQPTDPFVEFVVRLPKGNAKGGGIDWPTLSEYGHKASLYRAYLVAISEMHRSAHNGQPQTRLIGKPVLDKKGKQRRRKGGKVQRSKDELIPNPGAQYVRGLTVAQLTAMTGLDPKDKNHRRLSRKAFAELHTKGVIDLAQDGKVWRIFGPPLS